MVNTRQTSPSASFEVLRKARKLSARVGGRVVAVYGGGGEPGESVARGADEVVPLRGADPRDYIARVLTKLVAERRPWAVLAPSTTYGRDVLAKTAPQAGANCRLRGSRRAGLHHIGGRGPGPPAASGVVPKGWGSLPCCGVVCQCLNFHIEVWLCR